MERGILLETLANELPPDAISFSSKLANIEKKKNDEILLEFENGNHLSAEVYLHPKSFPFSSLMHLIEQLES